MGRNSRRQEKKVQQIRLLARSTLPNLYRKSPTDLDVSMTPSGRHKKVTMSYDQNRHLHVWKKTFDLQSLEVVCKTTSVNNVVAASVQRRKK